MKKSREALGNLPVQLNLAAAKGKPFVTVLEGDPTITICRDGNVKFIEGSMFRGWHAPAACAEMAVKGMVLQPTRTPGLVIPHCVVAYEADPRISAVGYLAEESTLLEAVQYIADLGGETALAEQSQFSPESRFYSPLSRLAIAH
jgi:hypothetical protein